MQELGNVAEGFSLKTESAATLDILGDVVCVKAFLWLAVDDIEGGPENRFLWLGGTDSVREDAGVKLFQHVKMLLYPVVMSHACIREEHESVPHFLPSTKKGKKRHI